MPQFKLWYFDIMAIGEPLRFLFHYGGIDFEDYRYTEDEWKNEIKPKSPFGQGPLLEIDGKIYWQHIACQRYLAEMVGLAGKTNLEKLEIDMAVESLYDVRCLLFRYHFDTPENKKARENEVLNVQLPYWMERLEQRVIDNNGYMVGGKLTWPDLQYTAYHYYWKYLAGRDVDGKYPNLVALREKVSAIPQLKAWIERRPKSIT